MVYPPHPGGTKVLTLPDTGEGRFKFGLDRVDVQFCKAMGEAEIVDVQGRQIMASDDI